MYMRGGILPDNSLVGILFNLGTDQLDTFEIFVDSPFENLEYLTKEGKWEKSDFTRTGDREIEVALRLETFRPQVLRFS